MKKIDPYKWYSTEQLVKYLGYSHKGSIYALRYRKRHPLIMVKREERKGGRYTKGNSYWIKGADLLRWERIEAEMKCFDQEINADKYYSVVEAAHLLGVDRQRIYYYMKRKKDPLYAEYVDGEYGLKIHGSSLLQFKRVKVGRPRIFSLDTPHATWPCVIRGRKAEKERRTEMAYHMEHSPKQREGSEI